MSWHAVGAVDDAVDTTRRFLFPFSLVRWAKLALLVLLMGGISFNTSVSVPPFPNVESETAGWSDFAALAAELGVSTEVVVAIGAGLFLLSSVLIVLSTALRLAFYDALRTNVVRIWDPFKRRLKPAAALFLFVLGVGVLLAAPFVLVALAVEYGYLTFAGTSTPAIAAAVLAALVWVVAGLLVLRFTVEFVVPVMVLRDDGPVAAWRRLWPTIRESWLGFLAYLVVHFVLGIGISVVEGIIFLLVGGTVAVLAGVVLLVGAGLLGGFGALTATTAGSALIAVVVLVALVTLFVVLMPVRVVTRTYLIAYEVSMLGRTDPDLMLLSDNLDPNADDEGGDGERGDGESGDGDGDAGVTDADDGDRGDDPADRSADAGAHAARDDESSDGEFDDRR
ncbi:hypothetical protein JCM17823_27070 [Halorubrum gandharaense]